MLPVEPTEAPVIHSPDPSQSQDGHDPNVPEHAAAARDILFGPARGGEESTYGHARGCLVHDQPVPCGRCASTRSPIHEVTGFAELGLRPGAASDAIDLCASSLGEIEDLGRLVHVANATPRIQHRYHAARQALLALLDAFVAVERRDTAAIVACFEDDASSSDASSQGGPAGGLAAPGRPSAFPAAYDEAWMTERLVAMRAWLEDTPLDGFVRSRVLGLLKLAAVESRSPEAVIGSQLETTLRSLSVALYGRTEEARAEKWQQLSYALVAHVMSANGALGCA